MENPIPPASVSTTPNAILLPICAALLIAANYVPLLLLLKVKKLAACILVIVLAIENVLTFTNAILWPNNNTAEWYSGVGLCDVQAAIRTPLTTLLASSSAYLSWDLAKALDTENPRLYESQKSRRRRVATELLFCFLVPVLQVALQYIVLTNRFAIATIYGCASYWDSSWPTVVIFAIWPPIFALVNCCFAVLVIIRLRRHRGVLSSTLSSTGSGFNARRFVKLFFLSGCILIVYLPVVLYYLYDNVNIKYTSYSWSRVHDPAMWNQIVYVTTDLSPLPQYNGWLEIAMACFLVVLYGLSNEGKEIYKRGLVSCGFGNIFPALLELRELPTHRRNGSSRASSTSRFDIITRVIHYYDGTKGSNQATTSDMLSPRRDSGATLNHTKSSGSKSTSAVMTADLNLVTRSSDLFPPVMTSALAVSRPEPVYKTHLFGSPFRTHSNLPHALVAANNLNTLSTSNNLVHQGRLQNDTASLTTPGAIETTIWSNTDPEAALDPPAPRMGTRAFRERARQIHEQRNMFLGVLPDTVTVDLHSSHSSKQEIKVERKLEIFEEAAPHQS